MEGKTAEFAFQNADNELSLGELGWAFLISLVFVIITRLPSARPAAYDFDEVGFLQILEAHRFPMHHTLFLAAGRAIGDLVGDRYRGLVLLDMLVSSLAVVASWWQLSALVSKRTAAAGACVLATAPVFWSYGAMAGNYNAISLVGAVLLGVAIRGFQRPRPWHPFLAAATLAMGAGYRQDIGLFWTPVFLVILWQYRYIAAMQAACVFTIVNLGWLVLMLNDVGGWRAFQQQSGEFAHNAGFLNSYWNLGFIDATLRYAVKESMALLWTLGPGLLFVPRGVLRLARMPKGRVLAALLGLSMAPALVMHLLVHFGVAGYALHLEPALLTLVALGIGRSTGETGTNAGPGRWSPSNAQKRLFALAGFMACVFWFYPTNYDAPGWRGDFDLAFARHTRKGLAIRTPLRDPARWRTINSQELPGGRRASARRESLLDFIR